MSLKNFKFDEFTELLAIYLKNMAHEKRWFYLKHLVFELKKFFKPNVLLETKNLSKNFDFLPDSKLQLLFNENSNFQYGKPGIRAQLILKKERTFVDDFIIEGDHKSIHVINTVSPAWTCCFPIAKHVISRIQENYEWFISIILY